MHLTKGTINSSQFVGIHGLATDAYCLVPKHIHPKEEKKIEEVLGLKPFKVSIGGTGLIGALAAGNSNGLVVSSIIEEKELIELTALGLKVKAIKGFSAFGNLVAVNDNGMVLSNFLSQTEKNELKEFFGLPAIELNYGYNELVGSSTVATNKGFVAHPRVSNEDLEKIKGILKVDGLRSTANYGDPFVRNDIIANSNGALIGENTSGPEMVRIDEGLSGGK
ncbi:translation initiation factor IF-6 [archaeon]|nr:translation initiation factor IF-6 [archaeon]